MLYSELFFSNLTNDSAFYVSGGFYKDRRRLYNVNPNSVLSFMLCLVQT